MGRFFIIFLLLSPLALAAQEFVVNTGADVRVNLGCQVIFAEGGMLNSAGQFSNAGEVVIEGNLINGGLLSGGVGSGTFKVLNDVENNGQMQPGQSTFQLYGADQYLRGTQPLNFYNLWLEGSGIKLMEQNVTTAGELDLNDRELRADVFTAFHTNPAAASIRYDFELGFVSAESGGGLSRATNALDDYFFPLGSANGIFRFRPANLRPSDSNSNTYKMRFANENSPAPNQLSSELYYINYAFYHILERNSGLSAADVSIYYNPTEDGTFETLAHLSTTSGLWTENPNTASGSALGTDYLSFSSTGWNGFENREITLATWSTDLFVPNVFSPNGDGQNDVFIARGTNVKDFNMVIFDRWGTAVFESDDIESGWDGTFRGSLMNSAVFVYYILSGEEVVSKGNVTLLR